MNYLLIFEDNLGRELERKAITVDDLRDALRKRNVEYLVSQDERLFKIKIKRTWKEKKL